MLVAVVRSARIPFRDVEQFDDVGRERLRWVFGPEVLDVIDEYDLDDEDDRIDLVEEFLPLPPRVPARDVRMAARTVVVTQILADRPPETWRTVKRLRDAGLHRDEILSQLTLVIGENLKAMISSRESFDSESFAAALDELPLPTEAEVARVAVDVVRAHPGIEVGEHVDRITRSLSRRHSAIVEQLADRVVEQLLSGPLHWLPGDLTVYVPDLVDGRTFTHRHNEAEAELGVLTVGFDLGAFTRFDTVRLADGTEIEQFSVERDHLAWVGPDGWLAGYEPGDLLSITAQVLAPHGAAVEAVEATVVIERADPEPPLADEVVAAVRDAYDAIVAEPGLPVNGEDLALWLCHHRADLVSIPRPPLAELSTAAGLELRGGQVAHDEEIWRRDLFARRYHQVLHLLPERHWQEVVGGALGVLDDPGATVEQVRAALDECAEPETIDVLADVLFPHYLDLADEFELGGADAPGRLFELVHRAIAMARRPREIATAEYLACVLHERCSAPEIAERHLTRSAQAAPRLGPVVERMGWYRFDRGDARGAMRWWGQLSDPHPSAATIEPFLESHADRRLGRNDPCWCGSGRKFKQCHQNATDLPALPDRVGWLARKATLWLEHTANDVRALVVELATARATGDPDPDSDGFRMASLDEGLADLVVEAFEDPIVIDAALHEEGLFNLFLRERGALLPGDEQLLASSWLTVDRSVHEVMAVEPGAAITLRDLATGDVVEVRERSASHQVAVGERYCARLVPDGATHQIVGGVFAVRTGHETAVLNLCTEGDGAALCAWVGRLHQPPRIVHTPGLIDSMIDRSAIEEMLSDFGDDADEATVMAALGAEIARQTQTAWLDESVPALDGLTPRQAAADPTRREQVERLLDEFERMNERLHSGEDSSPDASRWDIAAMRRQLGLER